MGDFHTIPFHVGDFIKDTTHLSPAEVGAYIRLLMFHYSMGVDGIPSDDAKLRRITGMDNKSWKNSRETLLSFFEMTEQKKYVSGRAQETILKLMRKSGQNRDKSLKRWNQDDATAKPQQSHSNAIAMQSINHKPIPPIIPQGDGVPEFDLFWKLYPNKTGKQAALKSYLRALTKTSSGEILEAVKRYRNSRKVKDGYVMNPTTWLNQGCWDDEVEEIKKPVNFLG